MTPHCRYDSLQAAIAYARKRCAESCKVMALVQAHSMIRVVEARKLTTEHVMMYVRHYEHSKSRMTFEEAAGLARERAKKARMPHGVRKIDGTTMWNTCHITDRTKNDVFKVVRY